MKYVGRYAVLCVRFANGQLYQADTRMQLPENSSFTASGYACQTRWAGIVLIRS